MLTSRGAHGGVRTFPEYRFYTEFQSHKPEFDYLKSLDMEERIVKIAWCAPGTNSHFLLTTNGMLY